MRTTRIFAAIPVILTSAAAAQQSTQVDLTQTAQSTPPTPPVAPELPEAGAKSPGDQPYFNRSDEARPARAAGNMSGTTIELRLRADYTFGADFQDAGGDVSVTHVGGGLGVGMSLGDRARLLLNLDGEGSWYNFSNVSNFIAGTPDQDPMDFGYIVRFAPGLVYQLNETWGLTGGGILQVGAEDGADAGDAITGGGYLGVRYQLAQGAFVTLGVIAVTQLEDDTLFLPLLGLELAITERIQLENEGLGLRIMARIDDHWRVGIFGKYEIREYRLADDNLSAPGGVLRDSRVPVGVNLEWQPTSNVRLRLSGGAIVYQQYKVDDSNGNELGDDENDVTPFVGLFGSITF